MGIRTQQGGREALVWLAAGLILTGLFTSRALLSIGMVLFILPTCVHHQLGEQWRRFLRQPLLIGMSLLFIVPFISGLWSEDLNSWWRFARIKLPLLILPFCFAGSWQLEERKWGALLLLFLFLLAAGCSWSLLQYALDAGSINERYLKAGALPTPLGNDHIRFSLAVCTGVLGCLFLALRSQQRPLRIAALVLAIFFILYLHLLAARTGLIALYILLFLSALVLLMRKRGWRQSLLPLAVLLLLPLLAWWVLPTFQNRIRYMLYDLSHIRAQQYLPGANDGNRVLSLKAGVGLLHDHPFGVGSGDVWQYTNNWYDAQVPGMLATDRFYPSSEWLMYAGAAGWPGLILFTASMLLPFFEKLKRERFLWISLNTIAAFSFLFDIGLESQFGVALYAFMILWWWKWLN